MSDFFFVVSFRPFKIKFSSASFRQLFLLLILPLYILDQVSKWWVVMNLVPPWAETGRNGFPVIEGYFNIVRVHNQGVAFGFGNGSDWAPIVFLFVPVIALALIRVFWKKGIFNNAISQIAAALLVCGILGNLTDRLSQGFVLEGLKDASFLHRLAAGYVVDFLDFTIPGINYRWPSFNVADSCICVAAVLLFIGGLKDEKAKKAALSA